MRGTTSRSPLLAAALLTVLGLILSAPRAVALPPVSTPLTALTVTATTGEKPQSKLWTCAGRWWAVMPNSSGTWVWRLDGASWTSVLKLSNSTGVHADVKAVGAVAHVLLFNAGSSELASIEYVSATQTYQAWTTRPANVVLPLDASTETATLDLDSQGRMWIATDYAAATDQIVVYSSDAPYSSWSGPVTLATGINADDISAVVALPGGKIGVLWSNQNSKRFGFRVHVDGASPATWAADEVPASQSALGVGAGMADDHLHVAVGSDGTLYAAVKTSYDTGGYPKIALLVRRPAGTWDNLYPVDESGTRPIVLLDESAATVTVVYSSSEGAGNILYKESPTSAIAFGGSATLISGSINDATSTKQSIAGSVVVLAGNGSSASGVLRSGGPAGWWKMNGDVTDASGNGYDATASGSPGYVTGRDGQALSLNGTSQFAYVPHNAAFSLTNALTIATWVRPGLVATQNLISKGTNGGIGGYELCLASASSTAGPNRAFFRINQVPSADTYRINSTTLYSTRLNTWIHLAATYDGTTMKLYVNGVLESSLATTVAINQNTLPVGIGGQVDGSNAGTRWYTGALDDARIYSRALSASEIAALANVAVTYTIAASAGANGSISPSGSVVVNQGANQAFAISANGGYHVADVLVDAVSVGAVAGYTFTSVQTAHTISASFAADAAPANLVGWWPLDEGSGSAVLDASGNGNHGTLPNGGSWVTGVHNLALSVNGTTQYSPVPSSTSLNITGSITLAAWVKTTKVGTQNVIAKALYGGTDGYELNLSSGAKPFLRLNGGTRLDALTSYVANTWTHIAATYDGSMMRIYVNGVLDNSAASSLTIGANALALGIGGQSDGAAARIFSGAIDDARVYSRALSAGEIAVLANVAATTYTVTASAGAGGSISPSGAVVVNAGASQAFAITATGGYHVADVLVDAVSVGAVAGYTFSSVAANRTIAASFAADGGPADLVGWWKLDGDVSDASTYLNAGSLPNGGAWVGGVENQALSLNGTSQYASVPHSASLNLASAVTLAAWIRPAKLGTQVVIAKEAYTTSVWGYALELSSVAPGRPFFRLDGNTAGTSRLDAVTAYPQDGTTWMHLAATFDGTTMRLYLNGVLDAFQSHPIAIPQNTQPLAIGSQSILETGRLFSGAIDDARVYSRALSGSEIQALMNHTITASAAAHGAISPAGAVSVAHGANQAFAVTADLGYHVGDVLVDAVSVGALAGYTFTNVTQGHSIAASFTVDAPPSQPTVAAPADQAIGVALAPTLDVVPTDPDSPQLTVNFYGRATNGPPGPDFTIVALPDAQNYTGQTGSSKNAMYRAQTQWCVSQRLARRIAYVAQLGDCVEDASVTVQWMRSDTTFKLLEDPVTTGLADGIPYGIAVGNHDQYPKDSPDNSTVNYNLWFGATRFQGRGYYGGHFADNNDTWFSLFSASGVDFIALGIEYDPSPDANRLSWADSLLKVYSSRRAIVVSHSISGPGNPASWQGPGQAIYDALKNNANLFLMLCGHVGDQGVKQSVYNGHTVYSLLSDYQGWSNGGDGYLRYMEFSPANNLFRVRTYSPWLNQYKVTADSANQFTLPYDMSGSSEFQLIGTATNVASGAHATISWSGLAANTQYEWYVTVSDGASTTTSAPTWTFTTAGGGAPPDPVANLTAAPLASGNGTGGMLQVNLAWTPPPQPGTAQVYRKAFGDHPRYRSGSGGEEPAIPATPAAAVAAGWTLTGVTAPGQADTPGTRGYWYYVVFTSGTGGVSAVSNRPAALDYLLGDVHNGVAACSGDNQVSTSDIAYLGANYGASVGADELLACLDVGPTTDGRLTSRPTPDGLIEFEDLVMFALHWGTNAGAPQTQARPASRPEGAVAGADALALELPTLPAVGESFTVLVRATLGGTIQALKLELDYDRAVVEMEGVEAGELLGRQGAQVMVLTPGPGRVDVALLGAGAGLSGSGELVQVRFRVKAAGAAALTLKSAEGRDGANRKVALNGQAGVTPPQQLPTRTWFAAPAPNPFSRTTTLSFALARGGAVELAVYGVDGRKMATLVNEAREPGQYQVSWDGRDGTGQAVRPGMYYARLVTPQGRFTRTLVLMR